MNAENKLVLGTVQFGMNYGINNTNGKPSIDSSLAMLDCAYGSGIRTFDTAYNYGNAEEILGKFCQKNGLRSQDVKIITKLKPNILEESNGDIFNIIKNNLLESLQHLGREYVDGYLLHTPGYVRNSEVITALSDLKKEGLIKNIGVSIYEKDDAIYAARLSEVDYIQIPYSILDQRLDDEMFWNLTRNSKTIFARSAFLQGLFFMSEDKIPQHLNIAKIYLDEIDKIIKPFGLTRQQAALMFSYGNRNIDYVVFGVDTIDQLVQNIQTVNNDLNIEECTSVLKKSFKNIDKSIIFPSLWKKN